MTILDYVKTGIGIRSTAYDQLLTMLIDAAVKDLGFAGVDTINQTDSAIIAAVTTYCKLHMPHAAADASSYDRLKAAYDEQKAQLGMATGYTDWGRC